MSVRLYFKLILIGQLGRRGIKVKVVFTGRVAPQTAGVEAGFVWGKGPSSKCHLTEHKHKQFFQSDDTQERK